MTFKKLGTAISVKAFPLVYSNLIAPAPSSDVSVMPVINNPVVSAASVIATSETPPKAPRLTVMGWEPSNDWVPIVNLLATLLAVVAVSALPTKAPVNVSAVTPL